MQWLVSELNHKSSDARRVGALRLLGCLEVPEQAASSLKTALLAILNSVRKSLNKKESTSWFGGGEDRSSLLPLLGAGLQACCAHYPRELAALEHVMDGAVSIDPVCARHSIRLLRELSVAFPHQVAQALQGKLPNQNPDARGLAALNLSDHLACVYLLRVCSNVVEHMPSDSTKEQLLDRDDCFGAMVHVAVGKSAGTTTVAGILESVACLARAGWVHLVEPNPLTGGTRPLQDDLIDILTPLVEPDSNVDLHGFGRKAVTQAALSAAIECGRAWSKHSGGESDMEGPFRELRIRLVGLIETHVSIALRWQAMKALVWTSVSPEDWRATRRLWSLELRGPRVAAEVEEIMDIVATKATLDPTLVQESAEFTIESLARRPELVSPDTVVDALTVWAVESCNEHRQVFDIIIRILDLPQEPGQAHALRVIQKGVYWFLGEFAKELEADVTGSLQTQEALARLQIGARYGDSPTRATCVAALTKIALASDDHLRITIYEFFQVLVSQSGGNGAHSSLHQVMALIDQIFEQKMALRTRLEEGKQWQPQELQQLATQHQGLAERIKIHWPRMPQHFFPLGTESEAMVALAASGR